MHSHSDDAILDMIYKSDNKCSCCYFTICDEDVKTVMAHPRAMICTDASVAKGKTVFHPRTKGSFPRALGRYVREKKVVSLPEMIRKMTSMPARVYGLNRKGLVWEGMDANIFKNIFPEKAFWKMVLSFSIPIAMQNMSSAILGIIDVSVISNMGETA